VAGIALFEWLAVFVGLPLFYFVTGLLNRLLGPLVGLLRRRLRRKSALPNPEFLSHPVRLLLLAFTIRWALSKISLPLLARQFWSSAASAITIAACVWLLILLNSRGEEYIRQRLRNRNLTGVTSLRLTRRVIDLLVIFAGVFVALHHWGIKATPALAGLGVGGIAVALAAQKTLENVIGGISLIFDQVVRVSDTLKVGDTLGTVEEIGVSVRFVFALSTEPWSASPTGRFQT
jgi:MscS family membrane protein